MAAGARDRRAGSQLLRPSRPALNIDSTLAGRAFRHVQTLASDADEHQRLWMPLLNGTERLGVVEVQVPGPATLDDPRLRAQCQHLVSLLGQLVTTVGARGDALDAVRRRRPRNPAAELPWQLAATAHRSERRLHPQRLARAERHRGGDAFDYAALPVRRTPHPLLLRGGKVVRALTEGRRVPFGLGRLDALAGEEHDESADAWLARTDESERVGASGRVGAQVFQPGDWLVVHTDGITEARDALGVFFGDARLADFLGRAIAAGQPPPETARRLAQAVLQHQGGDLQDDATVLLGCWLQR